MNTNILEKDHQKLSSIHTDGIKLANRWVIHISWNNWKKKQFFSEESFIIATWENSLNEYRELHTTLFESLDSLRLPNISYFIFDPVGKIHEVQDVMINKKKKRINVLIDYL